MTGKIIAIDQGTTSSRAILFSAEGTALCTVQEELPQYYPADGWVEHDAEEIWSGVLRICQQLLKKSDCAAEQIAAIGITNQRETTVIWDKKTGRPISRAIVWQDRRTAVLCESLKSQGLEESVKQKTGLLLDPYFSASKIQWILDNVSGARQLAEKGELLFGTIDCFLLWKLTGGKSHKTDATNASRTLLFNIMTQQWDEELLQIFNIPRQMLPEVCDSSYNFGVTESNLFGAEIPITGIAGDQQAALIGQACFEVGMAKSTYGTGCFLIMNTGNQALSSQNRLLTTVAYRLNGETTYGIEGSIFISGAAIQWLRDGLKIIRSAAETENWAEQTQSSSGVIMVPAFTGLGAPYWDPDARGALLGLTRDTGIGEIIVAALESVCFQTRDLILAMQRDGVRPDTIRIDGGMVVNNWLTQRLADILQLKVERPSITETTALGAAYLAGLHVGIFSSLDDISKRWECQQSFTPVMENEKSVSMYSRWLQAVERVRTHKPD